MCIWDQNAGRVRRWVWYDCGVATDPVTDCYHALHCTRPATAKNRGQLIGDHAFSVAAPRACNRLPTELKLMRSSTATFRRHEVIFIAPCTDYVMHLWADCRRCTTNSAVTVIVVHISSSLSTYHTCV